MTGSGPDAARTVAEGLPVVFVSDDASALGEVLHGAPDAEGRERLLAVMVGGPAQPQVVAAAAEMAAELWPWLPGQPAARQHPPGGSENGSQMAQPQADEGQP